MRVRNNAVAPTTLVPYVALYDSNLGGKLCLSLRNAAESATDLDSGWCANPPSKRVQNVDTYRPQLLSTNTHMGSCVSGTSNDTINTTKMHTTLQAVMGRGWLDKFQNRK